MYTHFVDAPPFYFVLVLYVLLLYGCKFSMIQQNDMYGEYYRCTNPHYRGDGIIMREIKRDLGYKLEFMQYKVCTSMQAPFTENADPTRSYSKG